MICPHSATEIDNHISVYSEVDTARNICPINFAKASSSTFLAQALELSLVLSLDLAAQDPEYVRLSVVSVGTGQAWPYLPARAARLAHVP